MPSDSTGIDLRSSNARWLFKQDGMLLGPVSLAKLIELLNTGEVGENTLVAFSQPTPKFEPLGNLESFRVHLAKAQAKLRVEEQKRQKGRQSRKRRVWRTAVISTLGIIFLFSAGQLAWWLATNRPWESKINLPEPVIIDELPTIELASARPREEEIVYPSVESKIAKPEKRTKFANPKTHPFAAKSPAELFPQKRANDLTVVRQWDQKAISAVVRANKPRVHFCLAREARRHPNTWNARVPIEFTIGNNGRVTKLWIDNPEFKNESGNLYQCMLAELQKWRFPSYEGEQANVSLAFRIKAR